MKAKNTPWVVPFRSTFEIATFFPSFCFPFKTFHSFLVFWFQWKNKPITKISAATIHQLQSFLKTAAAGNVRPAAPIASLGL
jgi:hypothetical protein